MTVTTVLIPEAEADTHITAVTKVDTVSKLFNDLFGIIIFTGAFKILSREEKNYCLFAAIKNLKTNGIENSLEIPTHPLNNKTITNSPLFQRERKGGVVLMLK